jgi:hypothetical protein
MVRAFFMEIGYSLYMNRLILLILILLPSFCMADVYKWVDADGTVHYGDKVDEGLDATKLPSSQYKVPPSTPVEPLPDYPRSISSGYSPELPAARQQDQPGSKYIIRITSPTPDATVRDNQGIVQVSMETEPRMRSGHAYQMYVDGKPWYQPFVGQRVILSNLVRGTHTIQVKAVAQNGEALGESNSVTFFMHRRSKLHK